MAPTTSSKGKATKPGGGKASAAPRSRNTTPLPNARPSVEPPSGSTATYFEKPLSSALKKCSATMEEILDTGGGSGTIPSGSTLVKMRDQVEKTVLKSIETRCTQAEAALRTLHGLRKNRGPRERKEDKDEDRKHKLKKPGKKHDEDSKHPPAVGAHGLARQDGVEAKGQSFTLPQGESCLLV
jgi:transcriptional adapter 3